MFGSHTSLLHLNNHKASIYGLNGGRRFGERYYSNLRLEKGRLEKNISRLGGCWQAVALLHLAFREYGG
jgi:hypothetical protein